MTDYQQKLVGISRKYTQLRNHAAQRLENFYTRHPAIKRTKDLVRDYGDMASSVAAGLALTPFGQTYGDIENRIYVLVGGAALGAVIPLLRNDKSVQHDSRLRNAYAGLAAVALGQSFDYPDQLTRAEFVGRQFNSLAYGGLTLFGAINHENFRRGEIQSQERLRLDGLLDNPTQHA